MMDLETLAAKFGINVVSGASGFFGALLAAIRAQNQNSWQLTQQSGSWFSRRLLFNKGGFANAS